ncbi:MAG: Monogalactosyldiacylglycerol synthase [Clostridiales bacterium]|jgi:processive 1,2-diacylglycerol beta-glucosyltransferase|nr:Monogalactosyldiacylglycerol synthase [Clostridiales bacterium]
MDVLLLSVSTGDGHLKAAEAIRENIEMNFPKSRTLIVDTFKYVHPFIDKLIVGSYINILKKTPQVYGKLYDFSENDDNIIDLSMAVNKLFSYRLEKLINDFKPSIIVCTHPFPLQMLSNLKRKNKINVPVVAIVTDFFAHPLWLQYNIEAYVVAHEKMKYEMSLLGMDENIIHALGIPVTKNFLHKKNKYALLKKLGFDQKLTLLIMGGSMGFGEIKDIFLQMLDCNKDIQIIVVTGRNTRLKEELDLHAANSSKKVRIFSYTDMIADLMDISDFIITKPGGMTISEALVKKLPLLLSSPIPGQEERNAQFLINNGAAIRMQKGDNVENFLRQINDNPSRFIHMKETAKSLSRPKAAQNTVDLINKMISGSRCPINIQTYTK